MRQMRLKIWHKMIIGIAIPSLIALFGGLLTLGYINNVKNRHGFVEIVDDLREQVLEARRNEKNFLYFKNEEHQKKLNASISILTDSINTISKEKIEEIGKEDFILLGNSIKEYSAPINDLYIIYQQEYAAVEKVRIKGRELEALVADGKRSGKLTTSIILNIRRLEKNYMLFRDKNSFLKLDEGLAQLRNIAPLCNECIYYVEAVRNLFKTYEKSDLMEKEFIVNGDRLEEITTQIAKKERKRVKDFFSHTQWLTFIVLFLLCTLGPFFVYKTSSYIVAPIKRLAGIAKQISEGDTTIRAPLKEHDETYPLSLSFNMMLDHLELTRGSLIESMALLDQKQNELEKRASLGFLISGVTHELNNPLNNISLTAETIMEDFEELTEEEHKEFIHDIISQSERAKHIIEDLLDYSGKSRKVAMEKIDIINAVEEATSLIANELRISNINLKLDTPDKAFFIEGNRNRLEEVFINIMVNACHAMSHGGSLTVKAGPDSSAKNILIDIADTGSGIPKENLDNIFEPFFTTKDVGEGTGLGLSVSQGIIKDHKGGIRVESEVGKGTVFRIQLPLSEGTAA